MTLEILSTATRWLTAQEIGDAFGGSHMKALNSLYRLINKGAVRRDFELRPGSVGTGPKSTAVFGLAHRSIPSQFPAWMDPRPDIKVYCLTVVKRGWRDG